MQEIFEHAANLTMKCELVEKSSHNPRKGFQISIIFENWITIGSFNIIHDIEMTLDRYNKSFSYITNE